MKRFIILLTLSLTFLLNGIEVQSQSRLPIWTYHDPDVNIYGISLGLYSHRLSNYNTNTYGIRIEALGLGILSALGGVKSDEEDEVSEIIYGLSLSTTGSIGNNIVYGIDINGLSGYTIETNGISISGLASGSYKINGIQAALIGNEV